MNKIKIYGIAMSYEVSGAEKDAALKAILYFEHLIKMMDVCASHLNLIQQPFKDNTESTPDQIFAARSSLRRYRDRVVDNFNRLKRQAFKCFALLQPFSIDTQIVKISKSFVSSVSDVEKQVNRFVELFENLKSKDFGQTVVKSIDNIKKELAELEQIVNDRIIVHINNNILARNWVDNVSDELQQKIENQIPLSVRLVNERNEKINSNNDNS